MILLHFPLFETALVAFLSCLVSTFIIFGGKRIYRQIIQRIKMHTQKEVEERS